MYDNVKPRMLQVFHSSWWLSFTGTWWQACIVVEVMTFSSLTIINTLPKIDHRNVLAPALNPDSSRRRDSGAGGAGGSALAAGRWHPAAARGSAAAPLVLCPCPCLCPNPAPRRKHSRAAPSTLNTIKLWGNLQSYHVSTCAEFVHEANSFSDGQVVLLVLLLN